MKIFITGHKGHMGKMIASELSKEHEIIGFDILDGQKFNIINNKKLIDEMIKGCDVCIHLAAIPHPHYTRTPDEMKKYFDVNVNGTMNVLQAAANANVKRFIYLSSTGVNGTGAVAKPKYLPIDENHPYITQHPEDAPYVEAYDISKIMCEQLVAYYGMNKLMQCVVLRSGPANDFKTSFPPGFNWKDDKSSWKYRTWWIYNPNINTINAIKKVIDRNEEFRYDVFMIANDWLPKDTVDVKKYLKLTGYDKIYDTDFLFNKIKNKTNFKIKNQDNLPMVNLNKAMEQLGWEPINSPDY